MRPNLFSYFYGKLKTLGLLKIFKTRQKWLSFTVDISEQELGRLRVFVVTVTEPEGLLVGMDRRPPARLHVGMPVRVPVHQLYQTSLVLMAQEVLPARLKNNKCSTKDEPRIPIFLLHRKYRV